MNQLAGLHFAVLVARGSNPVEFHAIRLRLREAGAEVVCVGLDELSYELEDHSVGRADARIEDVEGRAFDGVFIPGGLGPEKLRQDARVVSLVQNCFRRGKVCAAICHGQQVLISAGLMNGVRSTAAWSMVDDLRAVGAVVAESERAVRDGQIVTAMFPRDLPAFFGLVLEALQEFEGRAMPEAHGRRFAGQTWGLVVDDATDSIQSQYLRLRVQEEGGTVLVLGRRAGVGVRLGSPAWEWGEMGWHMAVDRVLPDLGVVDSNDGEAEANSQSIAADELDGLLLPGGLATWMIRGHPGLKRLIREVDATAKPIGAVGRGAKLLLNAGILDGRTVTCAPEMRDDLIQAVTAIDYREDAVVVNDNLVTCQGTEDLPAFVSALFAREDIGGNL